jgi:homoserine dehydrogenase
MKKTRIGLFGFGVVGQGLYNILTKTNHFKAEINKICVKNQDKTRPLPSERFTYHHADILEDENIDLVVEVISDAEEAYKIVINALRHGKNVVTANKKMVAQHLEELIQLQEETGASLTYEASSCGSIPIIRTLEEYFDNEPLQSIRGIFNGTCNYILSQIFNHELSYETALQQAQQLGFAEADPTLDISGIDALNKLCILTCHAFGITILPHHIFTAGIQNLNTYDIDYARAKGCVIKPLAIVKKTNESCIVPLVMPALVDEKNALFSVDNEDNVVLVEGLFSGKQLFKGKGAGGFPTGAAVLSDISANFYDYRYSYKKRQIANRASSSLHYEPDFSFDIYLRFPAEENMVEKLQITDIKDSGNAGNDAYAVGKVNLVQLLEHRKNMEEANVFLMLMNS